MVKFDLLHASAKKVQRYSTCDTWRMPKRSRKPKSDPNVAALGTLFGEIAIGDSAQLFVVRHG